MYCAPFYYSLKLFHQIKPKTTGEIGVILSKALKQLSLRFSPLNNKIMEMNLNYLLGFISLTFAGLSTMYKFKFEKLKGTGRIPSILGARHRQILFFVLAILSALVIVIQ